MWAHGIIQKGRTFVTIVAEVTVYAGKSVRLQPTMNSGQDVGQRC